MSIINVYESVSDNKPVWLAVVIDGEDVSLEFPPTSAPL